MLAGDLLPPLIATGCRLLLVDKLGGEAAGHQVKSLDITEAVSVSDVVEDFRPDWILNCAAFTGVDDAEVQRELALAVNAEGPRNLALALKQYGGALLHISTDYVLGADVPYGTSRAPYTESEQPNPCGAYGATKLAGEKAVQEVLPDSSLIVRTSWLHGVHGPNFINTMLRVASERSELKVVDDQRGSPTWAGWLAVILIKLVERNARGIFHASSRGDITWFDFAEEIFRQAGKEIKVLRQTTQELARPAPRPAYSTFCLDKLENFLGERCITFQEGTTQHLKAL